MKSTGLEHLSDKELRSLRRDLTIAINTLYSMPVVALVLLVAGILWTHCK